MVHNLFLSVVSSNFNSNRTLDNLVAVGDFSGQVILWKSKESKPYTISKVMYLSMISFFLHIVLKFIKFIINNQ